MKDLATLAILVILAILAMLAILAKMVKMAIIFRMCGANKFLKKAHSPVHIRKFTAKKLDPGRKNTCL